jgi:hypothetical protein
MTDCEQLPVKKRKGAFVSESALHFDGDKPNSAQPVFERTAVEARNFLLRPCAILFFALACKFRAILVISRVVNP